MGAGGRVEQRHSCQSSIASGGGTSGIGRWCSKVDSSAWNEAESVKIARSFWIAVTRRVEKLRPSLVGSTV